MISLINVVNSINLRKEPVGHVAKTLQDFAILVGEKTEILASKEYLLYLKSNGSELPFNRVSGNFRYSEVRVLCNYFVSLFKARGEVLLYVVASEALLWGVALFKGFRKIVMISYDNWEFYIKEKLEYKPIRKFLVQRGLRRLDGCIVTNNSYVPNTQWIRIPDYCITDEIEKYRKIEKKEGCVCVGEMRTGKDIYGLVKTLSTTDINLVVAGSFQSKELYSKIKRCKTNNIEIIDKNMDYDEYLKCLSSYKYVVLPYNAQRYYGRTSGVLLEGIFVGAIPIAPKSLLKQNEIQGLGYNHISEIPNLIRRYEQGKIDASNDLGKYQYKKVKNKVRNFLKYVRE